MRKMNLKQTLVVVFVVFMYGNVIGQQTFSSSVYVKASMSLCQPILLMNDLSSGNALLFSPQCYAGGYSNLVKNGDASFHTYCDNGLVVSVGSRNGSDGYLSRGFRIDKDGNMGIGTPDPQAKLHVNGNIFTDGRIGIGNLVPEGRLDVYGMTVLRGDNFSSYINYSGTGHTYIRGGNNNSHVLINDSPGLGKVGIGCMEHQLVGDRKLYVGGGILAESVEVQLQGDWQDCVFAKEYQLKPLHEVEQFISENKHLPNVPSEKEVKKDGINLGKMDATLLQKVEELTLYLIEQNKRIEKLEQENKELLKQLKK